MGVKIQDFTDSLKNQTTQRASIFLRMACDAVLKESKPVTPKDKGNLGRDVLRTVNGLHGVIEWRKTYASYQERGMRADGSRKVRNYTTPGTGPHFAENAVMKIVDNSGGLLKASRLV